MINIQWKESGKTRFENLLSENSVDDFVARLKDKGCTDIEITNDIENVVAERIRRYNSGLKNVR